MRAEPEDHKFSSKMKHCIELVIVFLKNVFISRFVSMDTGI